jgi:superfamily II DNA helicase RecQ
LATVEAAVRALEAGGPEADWRTYLATERTRLRAVDGGRGRSDKRAKKGLASGTLGANPDPDVLAALKLWRARAAKAANVPAYVIFHDTTLAAVAELRPATKDALLAVPGLGPVKAERYGEALLAVVAEHHRSATA